MFSTARKTMFSTAWKTEENRKKGKPGRLFSLLGPQIYSSQIGRKSLERKFSHSTFTILSSPTYPHSWPSHLPHLMTLAHKSLSFFFLFSSYLYSTPTSSSSGSLFFFFFFFFFFNFNVIYCFLSSLYSSFIYCFLLIFLFCMTFNFFFFSFVYLWGV